MSESSPLSRAQFTSAQLLQAQHVGRVSAKERKKRKRIPSYPIDNVAPDIVSDRDDGIYVEAETRDGGYRVHVTIADVAAHVRPGSVLADAAWQRAFTVYGPGWTDPMFPRVLEENLSLEHNQERLGLTVSMTLDKYFRPVHTNFTPVITHPDNSSYAEAQKRMQDDPQFQLMSDIALGIRQHYFQGRGEIWEELFDTRRPRRNGNAQEMAAQEMVATYMLLANSCVAEFFNRASLPFLYRNFDTTQNNTHAYYSTDPLRHTALEKLGLNGAYCHFTSPIRRAPDYFNGVMVHYVVEVMVQLQANLQKKLPQVDQKKLHHALWHHGPEIIKLLAPQGDSGRHQTQRNNELRGLLEKVLCEATGKELSGNKPMLMGLAKAIIPPKLPFSREELSHYATHMNALAHTPEMRQISKQNEKLAVYQERVDRAREGSAESLQKIGTEKFSALLLAAAITGDIPRKLFDETIARFPKETPDHAQLDHGQEHKKLDPTQDYFSIFVVAQHTGIARWTALKREVAKRVKHNPGLVNALYSKLIEHLKPAVVDEKQLSLPSHADKDAMGDRSNMIAALVVLQKDEGMLASPFYSIGHNLRSAKSHAVYSFLENYAFGQLQPMSQTAVPNLLYAELEVEGVAKHDLLSRMVADMGAQMSITQHPTERGHLVHITVQGGELATAVIAEAEAKSIAEAMQIALRRVLRNPSFKSAVSRYQQGIGVDMLNPHTLLQKLVTQQEGTIHFLTSMRDVRSVPNHKVEVTIHLGDRKIHKVAEAPNIDRAIRIVSIKALEEMGWKAADISSAQSWVTDVNARKTEKQFYRST